MKIERINVKDILELNAAQKGMLFHFLKEADEGLYNVQLSIVLHGVLNVSALQRAFSFVQRDNESLRSVFRWEEAERPLQIVLHSCPLDWVYYDVSGDGKEAAAKFAEEYIRTDRVRRFDLTRLPLRVA